MDIEQYKKILKEKKMTYEDLAKATGLSLGCIKRIMARIALYPRIDTIEAIEKALGVNNDVWTPEERKQGVVSRKKISVSADEEDLIVYFREIGKRHGAAMQRNLLKIAEMYAENNDI